MADSVLENREGSTVEALWTNFARLARDGIATLLIPWLAIALVDFAFVGISVLIVVATGGVEAGRGGMSFLQVAGLVQGVVVMTFRVALLKTLRDVAFGGPAAVRNFGVVAQDMVGRLLPAFTITLAVGVIVGVGTLFCVLPGVVALFFLAFAPYLVVAKGFSVAEAIGESTRWARSEWVVLLSAMVVAFFAIGTLACVVGLVGSVGANPVLAMPVGLLGGWVVNTVLGYLAFLWWGATYITAEGSYQVASLRESGRHDAGSRPVAPQDSPSVYEMVDPRDHGQGSSSSDS